MTYHINYMKLTAILNGEKIETDCSKADTLLDTLLNQGYDAPYSCLIGYCYACKCKLVSGDVFIEDDSILTKKEKSEGFILACQSYPNTDVSVDFD